MTKYEAIFVKVDGLDELEVGNAYGLAAMNQKDAETEACALPIPDGANFVKLVCEGRVVARIGLPFDA